MFTCVSVHNATCSSACPGCYLSRRPTLSGMHIKDDDMIEILNICSGYGIKELAMGINGTHDRDYIVEIGATVKRFKLFDTIRVSLTKPRRSMFQGVFHLLEDICDEFFLSVDIARYSHLSNLISDVEYVKDLMAYPALGLAIMLTPQQSIRLPILLRTMEGKFPGLLEYYLIRVRGVEHTKIDRQMISQGFSTATETIESLKIHDRVTFDHCSIMAMNGQKCGQHGSLDIDTDGGVRTCVYSRNPTVQLTEESWKDELCKFLDAVQDGLTNEIECSKCPILDKCESKSGEINGTSNQEGISVRKDKALAKETA